MANPEELENVLLHMNTPDTNIVRQATDILKKYLGSPQCVVPMIQRIVTSGVPEVRQMAAVLLRHKINLQFLKIPQEHQTEVKKALLMRLVSELLRRVRVSVASLVASLAKITVAAGQWPELIPFLLEMSQAPQAEHREMALMLFRELSETIGKPLKPYFKTLQALFMKSLGDPVSASIRLQALRAIEALIEVLEDTDEELLMQYRDGIPAIIKIMTDCIAYAHLEEASNALAVAFELLDTLVESELPVLSIHIPLLVPFMLQLATSSQLSNNIRDNAVQFVVSLCATRNKLLVKHGLLEPTLRTAFSLFLEPLKDEEDDEAYVDPLQMANELLSAIIANMPRKAVLEPSLKNALALCKGASANERKAGLYILTTLAEGYPAEMAENLQSLMDVLFSGARDPDPLVRAAGLYAMSQVHDNLSPDVNVFNQKILEHCIPFLTDPQEKVPVKCKACLVLESLFDNSESTFNRTLLEPIMNRLMEFFKCGDVAAQIAVLSTIRALAESSESAFVPFFPLVIEILKQILANNDPALHLLRAKATSCAGAVSAAVGVDLFKPHSQQIFDMVIRGMTLDSIELREAAHIYFESIAKLLKGGFIVLTPIVIPLLEGSMQAGDGVEDRTENELMPKFNPEFDEFETEEEAIDAQGSDEFFKRHFSIRTAALDEKLAAMRALIAILKDTTHDIMPYIPHVMETLHNLIYYPHEDIRELTCCCFEHIVRALSRFKDPSPTHAAIPSEQIVLSLQFVIDNTIEMLQKDSSRAVVAGACEVVTAICQTFGIPPLQQYMDPIAQQIILMFAQQASCQRRGAKDYNTPNEEDHDEILIDHVTDLLEALAKAGGPSMMPLVEACAPHLLKYCEPSRSISDVSMAIGCFGELTQTLGQAMGTYVPAVMPVVLKGVVNDSMVVRRNSAFCLGTFCLSCPQQSLPFFNDALNALQKAFLPLPPDEERKRGISDHREFVAARDNACSAVSKIIIYLASQGPPPGPLVDLMLSGLPLTEDALENKFVYQCLLTLFHKYPQVILPRLGKVIDIMSQVLGSPLIEKEIQEALLQLCRALMSQCAPQISQILESLAPEKKANFLKCVSVA